MTTTTCAKCILGSLDDPDIYFNENGVCNHCITYDLNLKKYYFGDDPSLKKFNELITEIKSSGSKKKYDVLIGLSGGVDSTYVAYLCSKYKLRALAVHLDNGWNSELSVVNIKNILKKTGFDLYTYVINWNEFKDLQKSYFKANVIDIEALTDHAISSIILDTAIENDIKYVLTGNSITTEGRLPDSWVHNKQDSINIRSIHKKHGSVKIKSYPIKNFFKFVLIKKFKNLKSVDILDYIKYDKPKAKLLIQKEFSWRDYGGKHYESVFTRFYQAYILPKKFKVDKRKSHYSTLICANQLTRKDALELIKKPFYDSSFQETSDLEFFLKKLDYTKDTFQSYIDSPEIKHTDYRSIVNLMQFLSKCKRVILFWRY
ncbi:MAG: N-acetyl sugar amidotransferase [Crocinitomicaceae bacterium]|nr:N-acetyl sugar amidotransferase [Crocinitomicaceae bacterium]